MSQGPRNTSKRDRFRARIKATGAACHICGDAIDYDLPHLDPMSFVIDHVIPLHRGGADALTNIMAAHRRQKRSCNSKKRARVFAPIVRRSGSLD